MYPNMAEVKLFGTWFSPFSYRVIWALKLKGIDYEYIEEDLKNKSPLLLQYNPVDQKIPVLVHDGKPIVESMNILEYIDETWPGNPLLPQDPYERSVARFWAEYVDHRGANFKSMITATGAEQEKLLKEALEILGTVEDRALGEKKFLGGDVVGLADLAFGKFTNWLEAIEKLLDIRLLDAHTFPRLNAWKEDFKEVPGIKGNFPNPDELFVYFKGRREMILSSASKIFVY